MSTGRRVLAFVSLLCLGLAACAQPPARSGLRGAGDQLAAPPLAKHIVAALPFGVDFLPYNTAVGMVDVRAMVHSGVAIADDKGGIRPLLVEQVPALDNGLWKLLDSGKMETTWRIRTGARWHDGEPFTTADLMFTSELGQDRSAANFNQTVYASIDELRPLDPQTIMVVWNRPFVQADRLFTVDWALPLPKHLLENAYRTDKAGLAELPYWTTEFVGAGPYKIREFVPGQHILLDAFAAFPLGPPKVSEVELKYIPDPNVIVTNALAGSVDFTLGQRIPLDTAVEMQARWKEGQFTFEFADQRAFQMFPQFINPNPAVVLDLRFRQAVIHALDRQEMVDTLANGKSFVMHTFVAPNQREYADVEARVQRYNYDPARSAQLLEELGYARGEDGGYRDGSGQRLEIEIWGASAVTRILPAIAGYLQRVGIAASTLDIPQQRDQDWPYRAQFPGLQVLNPLIDTSGIPQQHSSRVRLPENNFQVGGNWSRYRSAELDGLIDRYQTTIPRAERLEVLGQILNHIADQITTIGLYYNPVPYAVSNRLVNVPVNRGSNSSIAWNIYEWDTRS